jgi:putative membrane protein
MIDYVSLMLINMVSALVVLAFFLWWGLGREDTRHWAPAFGIAGLVATVCGFVMTFTWPIPKPFSTIYGEMSVLLGVLFLGAAWALARGWNLLPLGIYAFFSGLAAIVVGVRLIHLALTPAPLLPGAGFILTGLGGVCAWAILWRPDIKAPRVLGGLVILAAAVLWASTAFVAYWSHMKVEPPSQITTVSAKPSTAHTPATVLARGADPAACYRPSLFSAAQVSGTARGTAVKLASAAVRQYMQNPRYHAH